VTVKTKPTIDKRSLSIPKPDRWEWSKLDDAEIRRRLAAANEARERLVKWCTDLESERRMMWYALRSRLTVAKLGETQQALARIEDAGKQKKQLERLLAQTNKAIETIEDRLAGGRLVK